MCPRLPTIQQLHFYRVSLKALPDLGESNWGLSPGASTKEGPHNRLRKKKTTTKRISFITKIIIGRTKLERFFNAKI